MEFPVQVEAQLFLKMRGYPQFSFWIPAVLANICFSRIVLNRAKIALS